MDLTQDYSFADTYTILTWIFIPASSNGTVFEKSATDLLFRIKTDGTNVVYDSNYPTS